MDDKITERLKAVFREHCVQWDPARLPRFNARDYLSTDWIRPPAASDDRTVKAIPTPIVTFRLERGTLDGHEVIAVLADAKHLNAHDVIVDVEHIKQPAAKRTPPSS